MKENKSFSCILLFFFVFLLSDDITAREDFPHELNIALSSLIISNVITLKMLLPSSWVDLLLSFKSNFQIQIFCI